MASLSSRSLSSSEVGGCNDVDCTVVCWYDVCIPSPPPLSPNVSVPSDPDSTPIEIHHPSRLLPNFLIAAGALLGLSFFLLLLLSFAVHRRRRRRRRQQELDGTHRYPPPPENDAGVPDLVDDEDNGGPHHIWYIRTVGLDESVIKSIAATVYRSKDGLIDGGDCSVCLGEFNDGEAIKLLPKCAHAFHVSCIDTWLRSHVNCPLCRAPVIAPAVVGPAESDDSSPSEIASVEMSIPNQEECVIALDEGAGSSSVSRGEEEVQPVRRSVSMDSSALGMVMLGIESESEEKMGEERKYLEFEGAVVPKNRGKWGEVLGKRGVEMKRSLSSRSGRLFFRRYARGRSASVLPL